MAAKEVMIANGGFPDPPVTSVVSPVCPAPTVSCHISLDGHLGVSVAVRPHSVPTARHELPLMEGMQLGSLLPRILGLFCC